MISLQKGELLKLVFSGTKHHHCFLDRSGEQIIGARSSLSKYICRVVLLSQQPEGERGVWDAALPCWVHLVLATVPLPSVKCRRIGGEGTKGAKIPIRKHDLR